MTKREFFDKEFLAFCQVEYDKARNYLKHCGKPKDDIDRWFILFHKDTAKLFEGYLQ